ncbi:glycine cleavage system H protein [Abditibacteriota bacterium]|nr:glycine cleavage system H protein [Abditibacteriota bacterium]
MNTPTDLFYTESDEWLRREDDGLVTLGITDYAQGELGEIVYLELPEQGASIVKDGSFGVAESVKAVGELHSPIAGEVVAANTQATENPGLVNESPFENGWMIRLKPTGEANFDSLMSAEEYAAYRAA